MREDAVVNLWQIQEETFEPNLKHIHSQETVYTIGNGYFATRGTFEEGYPQANPATLLFGVFDAVPIAREERHRRLRRGVWRDWPGDSLLQMCRAWQSIHCQWCRRFPDYGCV